MYNRYLHNDDAAFRPVPFPEESDEHRQNGSPFSHLQDFLHLHNEGSPIARLLERFHLEELDTGDLMLLVLLFFLMEEKADDELLIALGLLLIL